MSAKVPVPTRAATTAEPGTAACPEERPTGRSTAREKWTMCLGTSRPTCTSTTWSTPRIFADFDAFCKRQDTFKIGKIYIPREARNTRIRFSREVIELPDEDVYFGKHTHRMTSTASWEGSEKTSVFNELRSQR